MKARPLSILVAALFSASAIAAGNSSQGASAQEPQAQPQAGQQSGQMSEPRGAGASQSAQSGNPELVKQAQEKLSAAGHDAGPSDGVMGPKTQAALKEFQQAKGIEASGQLDQETVAALELNESGASTGSSSSAGASSPSSSSSGASSSDSPSATGSQPPSQPGSEGKQK